uniref:Family with sequence similarity 117 member Aa n=1 Tax=Esox lucius TaxID=8010 RepID=A0AAY5L547_ESOLU
MSCRGAAARGGTHCLQPLRATVPFQLHSKAQPRCKDAKTGDRNKSRPPKPTIRRTLSLDTIVGPYLQGQWPKETEAQGVNWVNDKATQTPSSWAEEPRGRRSVGGHKRSASWGSAEHLREVAKLRHQLQKRSRHAPISGGHEHAHHRGGQAPSATQDLVSPSCLHHSPTMTGMHADSSLEIHRPSHTPLKPLPCSPFSGLFGQTTPLSRLAPRLRRSVEGLNLELEGVFVSEKPEDQHKILDVPDGHRAPVPAQRCSSGSQSEPSPASLDPALLSPSESPCALDPALLSESPSLMGVPEPVDCETLCPSPHPVVLDPCLLQPSPSPRPNKTFQREPPEGCERVRVVWEEPMSPCHREPLFQVSCPDPNKVNFTPHGGSAFCPVSLLKPLLPSMDLLFRGLSVSPVTGCSVQSSSP